MFIFLQPRRSDRRWWRVVQRVPLQRRSTNGVGRSELRQRHPPRLSALLSRPKLVRSGRLWTRQQRRRRTRLRQTSRSICQFYCSINRKSSTAFLQCSGRTDSRLGKRLRGWSHTNFFHPPAAFWIYLILTHRPPPPPTPRSSQFLLDFQGYKPSIFYPKPSKSELMQRLVHQVEHMEIPTLSFLPDARLISQCYGLIVDALFGFSFRPPLRAPFDDVLAKLSKVTIPVVSVDIPSGKNQCYCSSKDRRPAENNNNKNHFVERKRKMNFINF